VSRGRRPQHGGMLSLLLTLLAIGALAWFALRGTGGVIRSGVGSDAQAVTCEQQVSALIAKTGGLGPDYTRGYEALPASCRGLLPAPGSLDPSAKRAEPEN